jgi:transcriptional regulator with XRE-family HTH domain
MDAMGLNQTQLAAACGLRPPSINDWFSGKTKMIDGKNLVLAARALNTTPEWIMTGKGVSEQSHELGINLPMMSEALVSLDKALRKMGLEWDAAYVAPALLLAYRERLEHPVTLDKTGYQLYDRLVLAQLEGEQARHERPTEKGAGGADEAPPARKKARAR